MICTPHKIFLGGQTKEEWMGGACGIWGRNKMHMGFRWVNLKKRDNLQDLVVDGTHHHHHDQKRGLGVLPVP